MCKGYTQLVHINSQANMCLASYNKLHVYTDKQYTSEVKTNLKIDLKRLEEKSVKTKQTQFN